MPVTRGKMTARERTLAARFLSVVAVVTAYGVILGWGWLGLLAWAVYWAAGIPATKLGSDLYDFVFERKYDPQVQDSDSETVVVTASIYVLWIGALPLLVLAAFCLAMFRAALHLLD